MINSKLESALTLMNDINLNSEDVDNIYENLPEKLKNGKDTFSIGLLKKIELFIKNKENLSIDEIMNWIQKDLDENTLKQLQETLINDKEIVDILQGIFFDKMLD